MRSEILSAVAIGCFLTAVNAQAVEEDSIHGRPNIVVVAADQWRAQAFGFAGDPNVKTPHLDRLAGQSARFVTAVATLSVCSPARASWLTGQRALTHGVFVNDVPLNPDAVTLPEVLKSAGYKTAAIGKWHIDGHGRSNFIPRERRQGFDYWKVLECTHNYNKSAYYADGPEKLRWTEYDTFAQTTDACEFLRQQSKDEPFLLWIAWGPPHEPYLTAPEKYRAMYDPAKLTLRANVPAEVEEQTRRDLAGYYAHCTALDDAMGRLLAALRETGLEENTILVFTSDHGDMLGSQGQWKKQKPFDESILVPLLVRWPQGLGDQATALEAPVNTEDLMPTLLGLAGVGVPACVEGLDYSPYLRGGSNPGDGAALIASIAPFADWGHIHGGREYRGLRTARHTYVRDLNGPWLLFDNQSDPLQQHNLVGDASAAKTLAELEARLQQRLRANRDEFLPAAAYLAKWGYQVDQEGAVPYLR